MKLHCWTSTPYAHLNAMVRVNRSNPAVTEAEKATSLLAAKSLGNRVVIIDNALSTAFDVSDPVKFYGTGPFIADDLAWSRVFFGRLEQLKASIDRLVFDREAHVTLFEVEKTANVPATVSKLFADPACQGRIPASVTKFTSAEFEKSHANRVVAYTAFNRWAYEYYYLQAFRDAYMTPAREALGQHVKASEYNTGIFGVFREPGGEWPHMDGVIGSVASPCTYFVAHNSLPTLDARRDYQLARMKACIAASKSAGIEVIPWIAGVSFDEATQSYTLDPMYGVDYVRRMIDLGVKEFLYWNPPMPYRDEKTILRDDAMMAVLASE